MIRAVIADSLPEAMSFPPDDTASLTRRLVTGEDAAWREVHARYASRLWRYLLVVSRGDEQAAEEALQRTFVRAARYARVWETEAALWGWLTLLARQVSADSRRAESRWRSFLRRFTTEHPGPAEEVPADPLPALLDAAWTELSEEDRFFLAQKYHESRSVRQLAESAGLPEKTVESRLTRARDRLRQKLLHHLKS